MMDPVCLINRTDGVTLNLVEFQLAQNMSAD